MLLVMIINNCDGNKVFDSETPTPGVRAKPIIKVKINSNNSNNSNPKPKAEADNHLILEALARVNGNTKNLENLISNLSELVSRLLDQQRYRAIRERERRW
jgi:hypothetical protein